MTNSGHENEINNEFNEFWEHLDRITLPDTFSKLAQYLDHLGEDSGLCIWDIVAAVAQDPFRQGDTALGYLKRIITPLVRHEDIQPEEWTEKFETWRDGGDKRERVTSLVNQWAADNREHILSAIESDFVPPDERRRERAEHFFPSLMSDVAGEAMFWVNSGVKKPYYDQSEELKSDPKAFMVQELTDDFLKAYREAVEMSIFNSVDMIYCKMHEAGIDTERWLYAIATDYGFCPDDAACEWLEKNVSVDDPKLREEIEACILGQRESEERQRQLQQRRESR